MRFVKTLILTSAFAIAAIPSTPALAEAFGLLNGRSMNFDRLSEISVEVGAIFGDVGDADYEGFGARLNYKVTPVLVAYGDIGQADVGNNPGFDGTPFGIGFYMNVDGITTTMDFAIHGSFHKADLEGPGNSELELDSIVLEGVFSSREPINTQGTIYWNASVGVSRRSSDTNFGPDDSETDITFSGGVVLPRTTGAGEFFGGILYVDDISFGGGYRHFIQ